MEWIAGVKEVTLWRAAGRWEDSVVDVLLRRVKYDIEAPEKALSAAVDLKVMLIDEEWSGISYEEVDYTKQYNVVIRLLDAGCNPNGLEQGEPLHIAISGVIQQGALKALLERRADTDAKQERVRTAL